MKLKSFLTANFGPENFCRHKLCYGNEHKNYSSAFFFFQRNSMFNGQVQFWKKRNFEGYIASITVCWETESIDFLIKGENLIGF